MWLFSGEPDDSNDDTVIENERYSGIVFRSDQINACWAT
jgi:hypothetical protein